MIPKRPELFRDDEYQIISRYCRQRRPDLWRLRMPLLETEQIVARAVWRSLPVDVRASLIADALDVLLPRRLSVPAHRS